MEWPKLTLILFCLLCVSSLSSQHEQLSRKNGIVRQKKKVTPLKKPMRTSQLHHQQQHERPARRSNFPPRDATSTDQDFVATSEHPTASWKPITYAVYSRGPIDTLKPTESTVPIAERTDRPQPRQEDQVTDQNQEYTLYQYYIPFEQLITHHSKPIIEHAAEPPKEPLNLDKLNKAAVEPVAVFKKENEGESSSHSENDNEFTGRYEYEYFVQDDHWGTNFGHKEYRDEKYTKGDYEVVLPDGRVQHVKYWSDATGYHASVTYHPLFQKYKHVK